MRMFVGILGWAILGFVVGTVIQIVTVVEIGEYQGITVIEGMLQFVLVIGGGYQGYKREVERRARRLVVLSINEVE